MPKVKLTPKFVTEVMTTKDKEKYQDTVQNGLVLRVTPKGKVYYFIATIPIPNRGKRQIEKKIGRVEDITLSAAREQAKAFLGAYISQASDPMFAYTKPKTVRRKLCKLSDVYQKWLLRYEKQKDTSKYENMQNGYSVLAKIYYATDTKGKPIVAADSLADLRLDELTEKKITSWQTAMAEDVGQKPSSINRVCLELKHLLLFAIDEGLAGDDYQLPSIKKLSEKEIDPKKDYFKDDEHDTLLKGIDKYVNEENHGGHDMNYIRDIMHFLLYTGLRPASVVGLEWRDIDFSANVITLRAANIKTKRTDVCVPSNAAREILQKRYKEHTNVQPTDRVFTNYCSDMICRKIKKVLKYVFGDDTEHSAYSFRHTFATYLAQENSLPIVMRAMNHRRIETTMKYIAVEGEQVRAAVNNLAFGEDRAARRERVKDN